MEKELNVIELFGGIGACTKALKNLGVKVNIIDYVEIDKYACKSYNAINNTNFEPQDIMKWDKHFENIDLITHGSPCQDFSLAGKQQGGDEGSGTRSSLMYETLRIVADIKPKYVLWENVKNLLSKKHRHNFDNYLNYMNDLGYTNYYQVLNAKDYGIPQNRERVFTISIRNDIDKKFVFPPKEELKLKLKDMLDENVDEKYYLSDVQINRIKTTNYNVGKTRIQEKEYCDTLCARDWKDPKCVQIGELQGGKWDKMLDSNKRVYSEDGISPTIQTCQGGNTEPKVMIKNATKKGYDEATDGDSVNLQYPDSNTRRGRVGHQISQTLMANDSMGCIIGSTQKHATISRDGIVPTLTSTMGVGGGHVPMHNYGYKIRKLTPKECWRLMGFDDFDFEKAEKENSNTQLYKQAGNSIVVKVLEKIFQNLL